MIAPHQQLQTKTSKRLRRIKLLLIIFIAGLVFSGITAFPLEWELKLGQNLSEYLGWNSELSRWIERAHTGVRETNSKYPFIAYGTDWLAFAHLVIAVAFVGPLRDPVKNIWVVEFGIIACAGVFPLAFIAGEIREIPVFWRVFDCIFGVVGGGTLFFCYRDITRLEILNEHR